VALPRRALTRLASSPSPLAAGLLYEFFGMRGPYSVGMVGMLVAGVYSFSGNPVVTLLSLGGDGRWVRDSVLAIAAAAAGGAFIAWSLGSRWRPAFTPAAARFLRMQGGIAGGRPGRLGHHPDL